MAKKTRYRAERNLKLGTPTQKRCARCGRRISPGKASLIEGQYYGTECVQVVLDELNSQGKSE